MTYFKKNKNNKTLFIAIGAIIAIAAGIGIAAATNNNNLSGLPMGGNDKMVMHSHSNLSLIVDGKSMALPKDIGIDPSLYKNRTLDTYGMKMPDMPSMPVMAVTHTHDTSGTIHIESTINRDYTFGDFLNIWGVDWSGKTAKMTVNGEPVPDYRNYVFKNEDQIMLEVQ